MPTWNKKRSGGGPFYMGSYGQGKNPIMMKGEKTKEQKVKEYKEKGKKYESMIKANPESYEKRKLGIEGESKGGTWTHKGTGKSISEYSKMKKK
jgi:hypothetical protein